MGGFALSTSTSIANDLTRSSIFPTPISIAPSPCFFPHHLPSFHGVFASTKQKKRRSSGSSPSRSWSYEHLMVVWDEVFERCCSDPARASLVRNLSHNGLALHGRGCVLVYESVQTKPRGKGTGFTSKPSKSSLDLPFFETVEWRASYVPREFLIDPSKAAVEALNAPNGGAVIDAAPASKNSETHIDNDAASKEDDNASEEKAAPDQCRQAESCCPLGALAIDV